MLFTNEVSSLHVKAWKKFSIEILVDLPPLFLTQRPTFFVTHINPPFLRFDRFRFVLMFKTVSLFDIARIPNRKPKSPENFVPVAVVEISSSSKLATLAFWRFLAAV